MISVYAAGSQRGKTGLLVRAAMAVQPLKRRAAQRAALCLGLTELALENLDQVVSAIWLAQKGPVVRKARVR